MQTMSYSICLSKVNINKLCYTAKDAIKHTKKNAVFST